MRSRYFNKHTEKYRETEKMRTNMMMKNIQNSSVLNARKNENRISCTGRQCKRHQRRALRVHIRKKICREEFCSVYNFLVLLAKIDTSTEMTYSIHTNAPTSKSTKNDIEILFLVVLLLRWFRYFFSMFVFFYLPFFSTLTARSTYDLWQN